MEAAYPVTAEVAGSSPVVPAIQFKGVPGSEPGDSYPQLHPRPLAHGLRFDGHGVKKCLLSRDHLVKALVRIQIERRLNPCVPQDSLDSFRVLRLVDQPIRKAVTEVV